jgi:hypothetical protein
MEDALHLQTFLFSIEKGNECFRDGLGLSVTGRVYKTERLRHYGRAYKRGN